MFNNHEDVLWPRIKKGLWSRSAATLQYGFCVFRVFKLGKYSTGLQMFAQVIATSVSALLLLIFFLLIAVVLFGSLAYYSEKGEWNHELGGFARPVRY